MSFQIRDRVRELRRVKASDLRPNPRNWRSHPAAQLDALKGVLAEVGYAGAALARELPDGSLELIDVHARAEISGDAELPVLVLDVTDEEAKKILATFDPLGSLADTETEKLELLLSEVEFDNDAVNEMLSNLLGGTDDSNAGGDEAGPTEIKEQFQILVTCKSEAEQAALLERFAVEGLECRSLIS